jgi:hypothetical protein
MQVVRLPVGEQAPKDVDCISINLLDSDQALLQGSILVGDESIAIIGGEPYGSAREAEAAGVAWASEQGVALLYVATSSP